MTTDARRPRQLELAGAKAVQATRPRKPSAALSSSEEEGRCDRSSTRRQQAEQRVLVIRNALEVADAELGRALAERDWEVFDLASFEEYCAEKLPELVHIKLRVTARRARTKVLIEADPTVTEREIAAATGASPATAHRDVLAVTGREVASNEAAETPASLPTHVLAAQIIAQCGTEGGTTREVMRGLRWEQGPASVALSRAAKKKLVVPTGERRHATAASIGFTVYRVAD